MERYTLYLEWKNQYCQNDYTSLSNLHIQCNPYQTTNGNFLTELGKKKKTGETIDPEYPKQY